MVIRGAVMAISHFYYCKAILFTESHVNFHFTFGIGEVTRIFQTLVLGSRSGVDCSIIGASLLLSVLLI
jgi:hypothetical protein